MMMMMIYLRAVCMDRYSFIQNYHWHRRKNGPEKQCLKSCLSIRSALWRRGLHVVCGFMMDLVCFATPRRRPNGPLSLS